MCIRDRSTFANHLIEANHTYKNIDNNMNILHAVSYTHLDVYKRQVMLLVVTTFWVQFLLIVCELFRFMRNQLKRISNYRLYNTYRTTSLFSMRHVIARVKNCTSSFTFVYKLVDRFCLSMPIYTFILSVSDCNTVLVPTNTFHAHFCMWSLITVHNVLPLLWPPTLVCSTISTSKNICHLVAYHVYKVSIFYTKLS